MALKKYLNKGLLECGCDEAGRGCLAGPVVAAAVILKPKAKLPGINDSKALSEKARLDLFPRIQEQSIAWAIAWCDNDEIDRLNILNASFLAMERAVEQLQVQPEFLLIDGNRFKTRLSIPFSCQIKGDGRFLAIAAASILAKTYRDNWMQELHEMYPMYGWNGNKGYPTTDHREAIDLQGLSPLHRRSFRKASAQLEFSF
jgi:ribonuclease HII